MKLIESFLKEVNRVEIKLVGGYAIFAVICMVSSVGAVAVFLINNLFGW